MWTIAVWTRKGGAGKSTLAAALGAFAAEKARVVLIDADPQESLAAWSRVRDAVKPAVATSSLMGLEAALTAANIDGYATAIVDLPGSLGPGEARALHLADVVLIPARPSFFDLDATAASIAVAKAAKATVAVVLCQVRGRGRDTDRGRSREAAEVRSALADLTTVLTPEATELVAYPRSIANGMGPTEYEPIGAAADEVRAIFAAVNALRRKHGSKA